MPGLGVDYEVWANNCRIGGNHKGDDAIATATSIVTDSHYHAITDFFFGGGWGIFFLYVFAGRV